MKKITILLFLLIFSITILSVNASAATFCIPKNTLYNNQPEGICKDGFKDGNDYYCNIDDIVECPTGCDYTKNVCKGSVSVPECSDYIWGDTSNNRMINKVCGADIGKRSEYVYQCINQQWKAIDGCSGTETCTYLQSYFSGVHSGEVECVSESKKTQSCYKVEPAEQPHGLNYQLRTDSSGSTQYYDFSRSQAKTFFGLGTYVYTGTINPNYRVVQISNPTYRQTCLSFEQATAKANDWTAQAKAEAFKMDFSLSMLFQKYWWVLLIVTVFLLFLMGGGKIISYLLIPFKLLLNIFGIKIK